MAPLMTDAPAPQPRRARSAWRSRSAWTFLLTVLLIGLGFDLWTKQWSFENIASRPVVLHREMLLANPNYDPILLHDSRRQVLPWRLMDFKLVLNPGAVFGIGANQRWFFVLFTIGALGAGMIVFCRFLKRGDRMAQVALGLVLAGGLGNLYDRIVIGRVRDFIHVLPGRRLPFDWTWPGTHNTEMFPWVFNIADVLLLIGMVLLLVYVNRRDHARKAIRDEANAAEVAVAPTDS